MTPFNMPARLQAELHAQGVLPAPWFKFCKDGRPTLDLAKLLAYIEQHGEPPH